MEITLRCKRYGSGLYKNAFLCLLLEKAKEGLKTSSYIQLALSRFQGVPLFRGQFSSVPRLHLFAAIRGTENANRRGPHAAEASTRKPQNISYNCSHFGEDAGHHEMLYTSSSCPFLRPILENGTSQRQNHIESKLLIPFSIIIIIKISLSLLHTLTAEVGVNVQSFLLLSV
ncbi:hypothetical protein Tco_0000240 [Tanacetum coccineum]